MLMPERKQVAYDPARYINIETVEEAAHIIVTPTEGMTAKQRWDNETPALISLLEPYIERGNFVLDYGCGIGRLAKPLIQKLECRVVGVDISPNMRALATSLVDSAAFLACDPMMFDAVVFGASKFDAAIAVWALQHCIDIQGVLQRLALSIRHGGFLFVVNNHTRCLPVEGGEWADDGLDINEMIQDAGFSLHSGKHKLPEV